MSTKSFPVVVFIVFLIVATPNSAFGFAYYLDSGSYHVIDDDSHKLDDIFLDHNGFRDPGTKLEIATDGWVREILAEGMSEAVFNGGTSG